MDIGIDTKFNIPELQDLLLKTDDSFLNDVRIGLNNSQDAIKAIQSCFLSINQPEL